MLFLPKFAPNIELFKENFFTGDGNPKCYHNKIYPIDIRSIEQSIITLDEFKAL